MTARCATVPSRKYRFLAFDYLPARPFLRAGCTCENTYATAAAATTATAASATASTATASTAASTATAPTAAAATLPEHGWLKQECCRTGKDKGPKGGRGGGGGGGGGDGRRV